MCRHLGNNMSNRADHDNLRCLESHGSSNGRWRRYTGKYVYSKRRLRFRWSCANGRKCQAPADEYDALSRLTSVCEITSVSGSGTCGQTSPQTGFWTLYSYNPLGKLTGVTQNAQTSSTQT